MSEYGILRLLWWVVLGVLLIGIAVMDGFDLGTAILLPWIGRSDMERRIVINTVGRFGKATRSGSSWEVARSLRPGRRSMPWRSPASTWRCCCCSAH